MCVAVPVEIIKIDGLEAWVDFGGVKKQVNIALVDDVQVGDYVLLHAGCAVSRLDREEAEKTLELFKRYAMGQEG
ncbi:HypC/HybG/HupF family hydrogenase formation chaperone [Geosporobacter ferrireducens]|uniref:Hydrogenase assembly protein HupF n=1 Tax=Geosporobacter ferrireducens TaxID=1424294 RepID=A0A1D8GL66_9FIRM|nr:HypC/HybG/HupF family hydrogenase formation chaperone [Geosporobacter ferrireducens]AOT71639.1 hydrogenase assembly protein HupF [Geosporobacter ferrireducens]MTI55405.1 HypC/HybG/HupF family hydrogenase formation chaperone [Geosporobacter ferrireducens]